MLPTNKNTFQLKKKKTQKQFHIHSSFRSNILCCIIDIYNIM